MDPFDQPPLGAAVSFDPPEPPSGPRRGRMALVAVVTAGLIGGGIAGVSQLASADRPDLAAATDDSSDGPADETLPPADADEPDDSNGSPEPPTEPDVPEQPSETDGQIVLDDGDGDPFVIDIGDLAAGDVGRLTECLGLPMFDIGRWEPGEWEPRQLDPDDFPIGDLDQLFEDLPFDLEVLGGWEPGEFGGFGGLDGNVTITGPDGVSVIDLGENGSVTVTTDDGEITISTDGDATVSELDELFGDFGRIFEDGLDMEPGDVDEFLESLPEFDGRAFPVLDDLPEFEPLDPDAVQSCIDDVLGR